MPPKPGLGRISYGFFTFLSFVLTCLCLSCLSFGSHRSIYLHMFFFVGPASSSRRGRGHSLWYSTIPPWILTIRNPIYTRHALSSSSNSAGPGNLILPEKNTRIRDDLKIQCETLAMTRSFMSKSLVEPLSSTVLS